MRNKIKKIVIIGAGGFARETLWVFRDANEEKNEWEMLGFIDENKENHGKIICDLPILGGFKWFDKNNYNDLYVISAVGSPKTKKKVIETAISKNLKFCSVIHPSVRMSKYVKIGEGTIITAGNILTTQIKICNHVIINLDCTIGHDSIIEDYCTIAPGVHISGNVHLEKGIDFGTGAVIIQGITVGSWSIIGAGAVVASDVPSNVTAVGVPAKVIKSHSN
jgi:sugar O-acyltransferase (sialic acid O-acetyltransferase NeuD family)